MKIGIELKVAREEAGLTQEALAFKAGLHPTTIGLLEREKRSPTIRILGLICKEIGIPVSELVKRAEKRADSKKKK